MMKKRLTALILSAVMVFAMGSTTLAAEEQNLPSQPVQPLPASVLYYGTVVEVVRDNKDVIICLSMESERYGAYLMNISADTVWIDSGNRTAADPADLEVGDSLYVFHSPISTRSNPPQSAAYAVVGNIPQDARSPMYHVVEAVTQTEDGQLSLTTDNGGLILHVGKDTQLVSYSSDETVSASPEQALTVGSRIMAWYSIVLTSYPGQAYPSHIMTLPPSNDEEPSAQTQPLDGAQLTMELDGKVPNMVGRYENGAAMVPVAAVAQALGFDVTYTPNTEDGMLVTVESDSFCVKLYVDQNLIYGTTKIQGAVGMTGPQDYGKAPYIVQPGTTWAPAQLFQMLGKTVTLDGHNLIIQ